MDRADLFPDTIPEPDQHSLFGTAGDRLDEQKRVSEPRDARVRRKLSRVVKQAREARTMPFTPRQVRMWQTVFPTMATALPRDEAAQLRTAFDREIERLSANQGAAS